MEFTLSKHAADALREREIRLEWVAAVLNEPAMTEADSEDPTLLHALRVIPEYEHRVLRVIYNQHRQPVHVVTVYFDRAMKGKL